VNTKDVSLEIINAIDRVYQGKKEKPISKNLGDQHSNPISELITPEWQYSDSIKFLDSTPIDWNSLGEPEPSLISTIAENLDNTRILDGIVGTEFERSFCSWYQPYHYLPREKWGIHIRYDSWSRIASLFYRNCPSVINMRLESVKSAFLYLFIHELFHHIVENAGSILEIILDKPNIYTKYYTDVYSHEFNTYNCLEEALSNRYLLEWAEECHIDRNFLKEELLKQGPGYRNFIQYDGSNFLMGNRILICQIRYGTTNTAAIHYDPIDQIMDVSNPILYSSSHNVPLWLHRKAKPVY